MKIQRFSYHSEHWRLNEIQRLGSNLVKYACFQRLEKTALREYCKCVCFQNATERCVDGKVHLSIWFICLVTLMSRQVLVVHHVFSLE